MRIDSFRSWSLLAVASAAAFPVRLLAHPGHGLSDGPGAAHWFTSPDHLLALTAVGLGVFGLGFLVKHRTSARWLQSAGGMVALVAGLAWIIGN
jgi:hypothetical protein